MKIGIDGTLLSLNYPCGTKHYAEQLLSALSKIDKKNEYIIFSKQDVKIPRAKNFRLKLIPKFLPLLRRQFFLAYLAKKEKVDLLHFLSPTGSLFLKNIKVVTTVHDIDFNLIYPKNKTLPMLYERVYSELIRNYTFKKTCHFITNSNFTNKQLRLFLTKIKMKAQITHTPLAPSSKFKIIRKTLKNDKKNFLCMGDFSPRKNIEKVIEAYSLLSKGLKRNYFLKIVTTHNAPKDIFLSKAEYLGIRRNIKLIESPSLKRLVTLFNQATAFIYPSLYEGFGIPILEAMACQCPVITSNIGATKEVAGGNALLINPRNSNSIKNAMEEIIKNKRLSSTMKRKGIDWSKKFSWEKTAEKTLKVYEITLLRD